MRLRDAARFISYESILLAHEGKFNEAIANQALGFRIAKHGDSDGVVIAYLVAAACDAITLRGLEIILHLSRPNKDVSGRVRRAVLEFAPRYDLRRALAKEAGFNAATFERLRQSGAEGLRMLENFSGVTIGDEPLKSPKLGPSEQKAFADFVDAGEADYLDAMIRASKALGKPLAERRRLLLEIETELDSAPPNPVHIFRLITLGTLITLATLERIETSGALQEARQHVLLAGAALLAYRAEHSGFPERLDQAMEKPANDPFTGKPLQYRREGEGFVVYSVGESGEFDGGTPGEKVEGRQAYFRYPRMPASE